VVKDLSERPDGEHTFADPPTRCGVPYVAADGVVTTRTCFDPVPGETTPKDLAPTPFWPVDDESVRARVRRVTAGLDPAAPRARLRALLAHVNEAVRYGGAMGTRDGVLSVLARGYGRCWDKSDVLVTLCRAAGLPARQVAGWVPPLQAGHVWLEVHLEGEGWLPVDATTPWLGTSEDYLPFFRTSDGRMPIVYLAMPRIERVAER
jgi:transglutaminase-like putative cysteine protease